MVASAKRLAPGRHRVVLKVRDEAGNKQHRPLLDHRSPLTHHHPHRQHPPDARRVLARPQLRAQCHHGPHRRGGSLLAGDRVALLVPGSPAYVDLVLALLAAASSRSRSTRPSPRPSATASWPIAPDLVVTSQEQVAQLLAARPGRSRSLPLGRPIHCTSGTTGTPRACAPGSSPGRPRRPWSPRSATCGGSTPTTSTWCSARCTTRRRCASRPDAARGRPHRGARAVRPGRDHRGDRAERPTTMFCVPTHLQRLFAHWDAVGVPDLSSFRLVAHAGAPCPAAVKRRLIELFPDGSTWEFYGSTEGQFTACRSEDWLRRPGTVGRARPGRTLTTDDDGRIWCAVPAHARFTYFGAPEQDRRRLAGHARRAGLHRGRPRPDRRRRLRLPGGTPRRTWSSPAGSTSTRSRSSSALREVTGSTTSPSSAPTTTRGANGSAPRSSATPRRMRSARTPSRSWRRPSGPRTTSASPRCR